VVVQKNTFLWAEQPLAHVALAYHKAVRIFHELNLLGKSFHLLTQATKFFFDDKLCKFNVFDSSKVCTFRCSFLYSKMTSYHFMVDDAIVDIDEENSPLSTIREIVLVLKYFNKERHNSLHANSIQVATKQLPTE